MEKENLHNITIELLENDSFIQWVKSEFEENAQEWSDYIDQHPDLGKEINMAIRLVNNFQFEDHGEDTNTSEIWDRIQTTLANEIKSQPDPSTKRKTIYKLNYWIGLTAAACLAIFLLIGIRRSEQVGIQTGVGEQTSVNLPDQSEIILNSESTIAYKNKNWLSNKEVHLSGEAYFTVSKGESFKVITQHASVQVLGTEFNVFVRDERLMVHCYSGKIAVFVEENDQTFTLNPGQGLVWSAQSGIKTETFDMDSGKEDWRTGLFRFQDMLYKDVIEEFERQFDYKVNCPENVANKKYTGFFRKADMQTALEAITWPMGLSFEIVGKTIFIKNS